MSHIRRSDGPTHKIETPLLTYRTCIALQADVAFGKK